MANNIREIKTQLSLDGEAAFRKSLKSVDSSLTALNSELKLVKASFAGSTDEIAKNQAEIEVLQKVHDQLQVKCDALADAVDSTTKAYEAAKENAKKVSEEYGENSEQAKKAWAEVETLGNKMDRFTTQLNNAETKLANNSNKINELKEAMQSAEAATEKTGNSFAKTIDSADNELKVLKSELKYTKASFADSQIEVDKYNAELGVTEKIQEQLKIKFDALSEATEKSAQKYADAKQEAEKLSAEFGENSNQAKKAWESVETLKNELDQLTIKTNNAGAELANSESKIGKLEKSIQDWGESTEYSTRIMEYAFKDAEDTADRLGDAIEDTADDADSAANGGFTVLKGAAAELVTDGFEKVVDILKDTVIEMGNVDSAINDFQNKTGATAEEMTQYGETIKDLYRGSIGESMDDISDSAATVKRSLGDISPETLEEVTKQAITLRDVFGFDVQESMRAVKSMMDQFGISATESFNLIVQGYQSGLDQNGDLLDTLNEYSVQFANSGYDANQMMNMLANGAKEGTWSVDKLGDAVKELHINLSDGSADEALAMLGLGTQQAETSTLELREASVNCTNAQNDLAKSATDLEKAQLSVTDAQKAYNEAVYTYGENSYEAQKAANTLEAAQNSVADAQLKQEEAQINLEKAQSDYNSELNATSVNLDDIKGRLAAGGDTAKQAQDEILTALMGVEDEQQRYTIGQALMGTMWEDLGEDAVKALMNTQGEIDDTKDAMQDVIDLHYSDIGTQWKEVSRIAKTEVVEPLLNKALPKIKDGLNWASENMDSIIPTIKTVGTVVGTAFAAKKIVDFGTDAVNTCRTVKLAFMALNTSNPLGWIAIGVTALAGIGTALYQLGDYGKNDTIEINSYTQSLIDKQTELNQKTDEMHDKYKSWEDARNSSLSSVETEYNYYSNLWDSMKNITDENGKIKDGYENRAQVISGELSEALGIEIDIVDGQVQKYKELENQVDAVIEKKRANALIEAGAGDYQTALMSVGDAAANYAELNDSRTKLNRRMTDVVAAKRQLDQVGNDTQKMQAFVDRFGETYGITMNDVANRCEVVWDVLDENQNKIQTSLDENTEKTKTAQNDMLNYQAEIANYEGLQEAIASGNADAIAECTLRLQGHLQTAETGTRESLTSQRDDAYANWQRLKQLYEDGASGISESMVKNAYDTYVATNDECNEYILTARRAGQDAPTGFANNYIESMNTNMGGIESANSQVSGGFSKLIDDGIAAANSKRGEMYDSFYAIGDDCGSGLEDGINSTLETVNAAVINVADNMIVSMRNRIDSHSPSRKFMAIGRDVDAGLELGILNNADDIYTAVEDVADGATNKMAENLDRDLSMKKPILTAEYVGSAVSEQAAASANGIVIGGVNVTIQRADLSSEQGVDQTAIQLSDALISQIARKLAAQTRRYSAAVGG